MGKKIGLLLIVLILCCVLVDFFCFCVAFANIQTPQVKAPKNFEEAKSLGERFLRGMPFVIKNAFLEMGDWLEKLWECYIFPFIEYIWQRVVVFLNTKIEEKKPEIREEFRKEKEELKEELKQELPEKGKNLWEKFKEIIK